MAENPTKPPSLLRLPAVLKRTGFKRSTLYREVHEGRFPSPITLVGRTKAWPENLVDKWIEERLKEAHRAAVRGTPEAA